MSRKRQMLGQSPKPLLLTVGICRLLSASTQRCRSVAETYANRSQIAARGF